MPVCLGAAFDLMQQSSDTNAKPGMSTGAKWGLGIGIGCLGLILVLGIAGFVGMRFAARASGVVLPNLKGKLDGMTADLKTHGFDKTIKGQILEVRDPIAEPTIYMGQVVKVYADCSTNLAIVAQVGEIFGRVEGKLYFRGQVLTIQPKAEIMGGLDATAQVVKNLGRVSGEITGKHQIITDQPGKAPQ